MCFAFDLIFVLPLFDIHIFFVLLFEFLIFGRVILFHNGSHQS